MRQKKTQHNARAALYILSSSLSLPPFFLQSELKSYGGVRLDEKLGEE